VGRADAGAGVQGEPRVRRLQHVRATLERPNVRDSARARAWAATERVVAGGGGELELSLQVVGLDVGVLAEAAAREQPVEAARDVLHERLQLGVGRWRRAPEGER